jgi:hypothetical protein
LITHLLLKTNLGHLRSHQWNKYQPVSVTFLGKFYKLTIIKIKKSQIRTNSKLKIFSSKTIFKTPLNPTSKYSFWTRQTNELILLGNKGHIVQARKRSSRLEFFLMLHLIRIWILEYLILGLIKIRFHSNHTKLHLIFRNILKIPKTCIADRWGTIPPNLR